MGATNAALRCARLKVNNTAGPAVRVSREVKIALGTSQAIDDAK